MPSRSVVLRLVCALAAAAVVSAAPEDYAGKPIVEIRFDPPTQPVQETELHRLIQMRPGDPLRLDEVSQTIEQLYATGRYEDIAVDAQLSDAGVILTFQTQPSWFVGAVAVTDIPEPPNEGQLANASKLELGELYTPEELEQAMANLQDTLRVNGFYRARIQPQFERDAATQQTHIRFIIEPGERAKFSEPVIQGDPERKAEEIINATNWERWWGLLGYKTITDRRVQQGLERIRMSYQKDDHLMAKVELQEMDYLSEQNRVRPVLNIVAGPKVEIRTTGAKVSRGRLRQLLPVYQERAVDRDLLVEGMRNLVQYFQSQGYFDATVEFETKEIDPEHQVIEYAINRGPRYKLVHVTISGNKYFNEPTIRERMAITPASMIRYRYGRYSEDLLERDVNAIRALYQANGFRDVRIDTNVVHDYRGREHDVAVFIDIQEGDQWFVSNLELTGVDLRDYEYVQSLLQSIEGQPYSELNIATDRDTILNYYYNNGFPDAQFDFTVQPGPRVHTVDLKFVVTEGRRNFVRDVLVSGLESTDPELVRDRIILEAGDPLSQSQMVESQRSLYDLGIFARVDMAIQNPEGRERNKYVLYQIEEASRYSVKGSIGAQIARIGGGRGATDLTSPAGDVGFSPRISFGVSRSNFLGVGHTLSFDGRLSTLQRRGLITYLAPQFKGNEDLNLSFNALYEDARDVRTFSAQRLEGSAQLGQRLTRANSAQYRFTYRRVRVDKNTLRITPQLIPLLSQPVRIGVLSGTFIQDRRDDPLDTRRGIYNSIDIGLASSWFGSRTEADISQPLTGDSGTIGRGLNFGRLLYRNSTYHRMGREMVLARSLTFGVLGSFDADDPRKDVPLPERFFAGGASSHRGFPDNQAGARDLTTGFPIGGKAVLVHSTELRFPLIGDNVGGVFFHDAGNVYSSLSNVSFRFRQRDLTDFDYAVQAVGIGLRYRTPVGPIRLDLAFGVNTPRFIGFKGTRDELLFGGGILTEQRINRFQFHFSLGQAF